MNSYSHSFTYAYLSQLDKMSRPPAPPSYTCICEIERTNEDNVLIIITSISSSLCAVLFLLLIWYKFIIKKQLLNYKNDDKLAFENIYT